MKFEYVLDLAKPCCKNRISKKFSRNYKYSNATQEKLGTYCDIASCSSLKCFWQHRIPIISLSYIRAVGKQLNLEGVTFQKDFLDRSPLEILRPKFRWANRPFEPYVPTAVISKDSARLRLDRTMSYYASFARSPWLHSIYLCRWH